VPCTHYTPLISNQHQLGPSTLYDLHFTSQIGGTMTFVLNFEEWRPPPNLGGEWWVMLAIFGVNPQPAGCLCQFSIFNGFFPFHVFPIPHSFLIIRKIRQKSNKNLVSLIYRASIN
jgi:hypothetical protein